MIVVDTSAVIAILTEEPEAEAFRSVLMPAPAAAISAVALVEATLVASRDPKVDPVDAVDRLLKSFEIDVLPIDRALADLARHAFLAFGKGRGHSAALNIGDCFSYALAKALDAPLLFKGADFARTDVKVAAAPR